MKLKYLLYLSLPFLMIACNKDNPITETFLIILKILLSEQQMGETLEIGLSA